MSISKERRERLREALQAMYDGDGLMIPYRDAVDLLDMADELDAIKADEDIGITGSGELDALKAGQRWDAARQSTRASFDRFWSAYQEGDELDFVPVDEPHWPTVAAARVAMWRDLAGAIDADANRDPRDQFDAAQWMRDRTREIEEGREDG